MKISIIALLLPLLRQLCTFFGKFTYYIICMMEYDIVSI